MRSRLPKPASAVAAALRSLPHSPGVYIFRDQRGRIIYIGRSRDLASRVRSYWIDLGDRPHLRRMVERVTWVEPVLCTSEHEAAFLECDLLERHATRYNRTLGMESCVWLRLDANPKAPTLEVAHEVQVRNGDAWFGPYLGWEPVRQAAAALLKVYPLNYAGKVRSRSHAEMARSLGVSEGDSTLLASQIECVLKREPIAVKKALRRLEQMRDRAAELLLFEQAQRLQEQVRGLTWISEPQKLGVLAAVDRDVSAVGQCGTVGVRLTLVLRSGQLAERRVVRMDSAEAFPDMDADKGRTPPSPDNEWGEMAGQNAAMMARLFVLDAVGPLGWRRPARLAAAGNHGLPG